MIGNHHCWFHFSPSVNVKIDSEDFSLPVCLKPAVMGAVVMTFSVVLQGQVVSEICPPGRRCAPEVEMEQLQWQRNSKKSEDPILVPSYIFWRCLRTGHIYRTQVSPHRSHPTCKSHTRILIGYDRRRNVAAWANNS